MKKLLLISAILAASLSACTQLSPEDRAMISSASHNAQEAKEQSIHAADLAEQARADANRAAQEAKAASEKADRIFRQGQNK